MESNFYNIAENFFNFAMPCPKEIEECDKHRKDYLKKIKFVQSLNLCTPCEVTNIKNYYIMLFKSKLGNI
jgi:hypothetical protein